MSQTWSNFNSSIATSIVWQTNRSGSVQSKLPWSSVGPVYGLAQSGLDGLDLEGMIQTRAMTHGSGPHEFVQFSLIGQVRIGPVCFFFIINCLKKMNFGPDLVRFSPGLQVLVRVLFGFGPSWSGFGPVSPDWSELVQSGLVRVSTVRTSPIWVIRGLG